MPFRMLNNSITRRRREMRCCLWCVKPNYFHLNAEEQL